MPRLQPQGESNPFCTVRNCFPFFPPLLPKFSHSLGTHHGAFETSNSHQSVVCRVVKFLHRAVFSSFLCKIPVRLQIEYRGVKNLIAAGKMADAEVSSAPGFRAQPLAAPSVTVFTPKGGDFY